MYLWSYHFHSIWGDCLVSDWSWIYLLHLIRSDLDSETGKCCNNFNEFPFGFYGFWLDLNELINCLPNTLPTALWRFHLRVSVKVSKFHFLCISQLKRPEEKDEWRGIFEKSSIISLFVSLKLCEIPHLNKCK